MQRCVWCMMAQSSCPPLTCSSESREGRGSRAGNHFRSQRRRGARLRQRAPRVDVTAACHRGRPLPLAQILQQAQQRRCVSMRPIEAMGTGG